MDSDDHLVSGVGGFRLCLFGCGGFAVCFCDYGMHAVCDVVGPLDGVISIGYAACFSLVRNL